MSPANQATVVLLDHYLARTGHDKNGIDHLVRCMLSPSRHSSTYLVPNLNSTFQCPTPLRSLHDPRHSQGDFFPFFFFELFNIFRAALRPKHGEFSNSENLVRDLAQLKDASRE